jgi:TetR/AcrR family transcriptional regulator
MNCCSYYEGVVKNMEQNNLSRREREAERHRREILDAAEQVFAEHGYHATTVEMVAQRAEFAVGSIYKFFKGKEELYSAVLLDKADVMVPEFRAALAQGATVRERIENTMRARFDMFWRNPDFFRLFFDETFGGLVGASSGLTVEVAEIYNSELGRLTELFAEGVSNKELLDNDPVNLTWAFEGLLNGYFTKASRNITLPRSEEDEKFFIEMFLKGVCK